MNQWPYIVGAWAVTALTIGGYARWVLRRGRRLSEIVPPEDRRWM
jgi:hypothetical protein